MDGYVCTVDYKSIGKSIKMMKMDKGPASVHPPQVTNCRNTLSGLSCLEICISAAVFLSIMLTENL